VKLVRELVEDQIRQLDDLSGSTKGQSEGIRGMIMSKQKTLLANLSDVEKMLEGVIDAGTAMSTQTPGTRNVQLNQEQTQAMVGAIVFAINHMAKFVPGSGMGLPESMI
jgi:hypothetical protein